MKLLARGLRLLLTIAGALGLMGMAALMGLAAITACKGIAR